jgi:hypothetical protein
MAEGTTFSRTVTFQSYSEIGVLSELFRLKHGAGSFELLGDLFRIILCKKIWKLFHYTNNMLHIQRFHMLK